jgi:hypothetical protein
MGGARALSLATIDVLEHTGRDLRRHRTEAEIKSGCGEEPTAEERARDRSLRSRAAEEQRPASDYRSEPFASDCPNHEKQSSQAPKQRAETSAPGHSQPRRRRQRMPARARTQVSSRTLGRTCSSPDPEPPPARRRREALVGATEKTISPTVGAGGR